MTWNLFIDDERFPSKVTWGNETFYAIHRWTIARNMVQFQDLIKTYGFPSFVSLDHDLGADEPTGHDIAKWLIEADMDGVHRIPDNFNFYVHSRNPVGKANIEGLLACYLEQRK